MLSKYINTEYHPKLIEGMINITKGGTFISNIVAPLLAIIVIWNYIEHLYLLVWFGMNVVLFILRFIIGERVLSDLKDNPSAIPKHLKKIYLLSFLSAVAFGLLIWYSILVQVPDLRIVILGLVIFALTAGSIVTLGSVFIVYFIYITTNYLLLISALLYHGGEEFYYFAFTSSILLVTLISAGYKHHILIRNSVSLDETFKIIYEKSTDGLMLSRDGRFISCNQAILKMFGIKDKDEFLSANVDKYSPYRQPNGKKSLYSMAQHSKYAQTHGSVQFEWLHKKLDGKEFWCDVILTRIHLDGEELLYGVWRDISDRKERQLSDDLHKKEIEAWNKNLESLVQEEVEKNRLKDRQILHQSRLAQMGEMISMIAHQWRQPLTAISTASSLITLKAQLNKLDKETALKISKEISNYTQHLSATIDDFRDFFKQDKTKEGTNYNYLVQSVLTIMRSSLVGKNIEVKEDLNSLDSFMAYKNELKQVIINIMKNSQDILLEKKITDPFILLKSYESESAYVLEISDNGGGIDEEILEKVFDPYFSTKMKKDGTGLGLYMSKTIVEEHCGGKLSCFNQEDGVCFRMEIPFA